MLNNSQSNSQSFNDSELSNGFHLLTDSSDTIIVNTPSVPENTAHLYPRLAGSNWTSYLSQSKIIIGRSGTTPRVTRQNQPIPQVDIDFGSSKAISRKHCEVRYSVRRDRWELHVYGRNGIKLNQVPKKPRDKPSVLKTGALIEICDTRCVFILPDNYIKPTVNEDCVEASTPIEVEDQGFDLDLEDTVVKVFDNHPYLNTTEILLQVKKTYKNSVEKDHILHLLVLSPQFRLVPTSISMSLKESDSAKWMLVPKVNEHNNKSNMSISSPMEISTRSLLRLDSTDNMSISTPVHENISFSVTNHSQDEAMSISTSANDLNANNNTREITSMPTVNASFSMFFDTDEGWSISMPDASFSNEAEEIHQNEPEPEPISFNSMSIESIYSIWSYGASIVGDAIEEEDRPSKRTKTIDSDVTSHKGIISCTHTKKKK
ncbi:hypothetical protein MFLAVUS_000872 [Mucor flavus]|uniref:FHA domain-containing protein n=1 Tax=Mucor flavus TaxID=439312 RepID=A0ABP9YKX0_9FUNG